MRSKELADLAGVSVRTLRHYHAIGLMPEPPRTENGYREYGYGDLARLLRIKRLSTLGFSLERVGEVMSELDASDAAELAAGGALDKLDRELAAQIEQLEEQRRTITLLKREQLDPDLPVRFAQAMKMLSDPADDTEAVSESERTFLRLAANIYDDQDLNELETVAAVIHERGLVEQTHDLDRRMGALPADASEDDRATLVAEAVELLMPLLNVFEASNWDRPSTPSELMLIDFQSTVYNEAQNDVLNRIYRILEDEIIAHKALDGAPAHTFFTSDAPPLDPDVTS